MAAAAAAKVAANAPASGHKFLDGVTVCVLLLTMKRIDLHWF